MSKQPNILIFMTDQELADVVGPDHPCITPNADRLAASGIRFNQTYTCTAHCCPSRATFHSGLFPSRHGIWNNVCNPSAIGTSLADGVTLFSEHLRDAGYNLAHAGKWHVCADDMPGDRGWEDLGSHPKRGDMHGQPVDRFRKMTVDTSPRKFGQIKRLGWGDYQHFGSTEAIRGHRFEDCNDYKVVQRGIAKLPQLAKQDAPWCLYIGTNGPHDPFVVPQKFLDLYADVDVPLPASFEDQMTDKPGAYQVMRKQTWDQLSEEEHRAAIRHYWAFCTAMDDLLGQTLGALDATGQADDTLVIFMSDHGDYCGSHGLYMKGVPAFREAYHVPCIARWPSGIAQPGRAVDQFVSMADFAPTFCQVAGARMREDYTGCSLTPFFRNEAPADWRDTMYTQFQGVELYYTQRVTWTKDHKYVYNGFDFDELYDLQADPHETRNLAADPAYEEVKHELCRRMWRFAAQQDDGKIFNPYPTTAKAPWGPADALQ